MTTTYDPWDLTQRRAQIIEALTSLVQRGQLRPAQLQEVETLYARGRMFEAERIAGLAIWLAMSPPQAPLQELPERVGKLVHAWRTLSTMLWSIDQWERWRPYADTLEEFQHDWLRVSPSFYTRLLRLSGALPQPLSPTLVDRGRALKGVVGLLTISDRFPLRPVTSTDPAAEQVFVLEDILGCVQQLTDDLLWLGRTVQTIRDWELWAEHAPSYSAFLNDVLGVGTHLGFGLNALAAVWEIGQHRRRTLDNLETAVQILIGQSFPTIRKHGGTRR